MAKITAALNLSPTMEEFMGKRKASRGDVTKKVWKYIRDNGLNADGMPIKFDAYLREVLGGTGMKRASDLFGLLKKSGAFES